MKACDWGLIRKLAPLGLLMGIATVWGWVGRYEGWAWLLVALAAAAAIGRQLGERHFQHGLIAGAIIGLAAQLLQAIFFPIYMANNIQHTADFHQLPIDFPPRLFIVVLAPFIALAGGVVLGVMAWLAARAIPVIRKKVEDFRGGVGGKTEA